MHRLHSRFILSYFFIKTIDGMQVMPQSGISSTVVNATVADRLGLSVWYVLNPFKVLIFNTFIASPEYIIAGPFCR